MADLDGAIKLHEAMRHMDLVGLTGRENKDGTVDLDIYMNDGNDNVLHTTGKIDCVSSVAWIQLPMAIADEIACQYGADQREDYIDTADTSTHADLASAPEKAGTEDAERRAPSPCEWHEGFTTQKRKPFRGSWAYCYACEQFIPRGGKNKDREFPADDLADDESIVSATLVEAASEPDRRTQ